MLRYDPAALRRLRLAQRLRVDTLALKAGVSIRQIYDIEREFSCPRASTLAKIAVALKVGPEAFFKP